MGLFQADGDEVSRGQAAWRARAKPAEAVRVEAVAWPLAFVEDQRRGKTGGERGGAPVWTEKGGRRRQGGFGNLQKFRGANCKVKFPIDLGLR